MEPFLISLFFALLIIGGYYSFFILPRQRAFRQHYKTVTSIEVGQEVVTSGGLIGTIKHIDAEQGVVTLELAPGVEIRILAVAVNRVFDAEGIADSARHAAG